MDLAKALYYFTKSFFKTSWEFNDYPIRIKRVASEGESNIYLAQIIRWWNVAGTGETPESALNELMVNFQSINTQIKRLPRPGVSSFLPNKSK